MDNTAQEFARKIIAILEHIRDLLTTHTPRKQDEEAISNKDEAHKEQVEVKPCSPVLPQRNPSKIQTENPKSKWRRPFEWWKTRIEIVALIAGVGYAIITYLQWQDLRHNFAVDQRAWLTFKLHRSADTPEIESVTFTSNQPVTYPFRLVNVGKTPAINIEAHVFVDIVDAQHEPALGDVDIRPSHHPHGRITSGIVFPNDDLAHQITRPAKDSSPMLATPEEVSSIASGNAYLAVYGIATYDDILGAHHWTRFCRWIGGRGTFRAESCTKYNSVDSN
jgi:hypothetical protein